jgi:hypothetical protein BACCOPRO_03315
MNEDWLQKVHDRMTDYEIDEPGNLWDAIESQRAKTSSNSRPMKRPVMIWVKRSIAAAAMIAVVISVGVYLINIKQEASQPPLLTKVSDNSVSGLENRPQNTKVTTVQDKQPSKTLIAQNILPVHDSDMLPAMPSVQKEVQAETADNHPYENRDNSSVVEEKPVKTNDASEKVERIEKQQFPSKTDNGYIASIPKKASTSNNVSVSIYSSGGTGSALNYNSKGDSFVGVGVGPDDSDWADNPLLGILVFNQGKDIETDIKHRLPIRAGVSFTYNFNERFGIETGLSYTNLISDVREGSESHYYTGEQKLHYIGIPLNLKYRVFSWKRFDLYASTGALAEKCVSAKLDKDFILDHQKKGNESENLSEKPMQWSVNASLGVQCNLVNSMSIFVEPGISYYFNDGTNIQTIYKEKPLNFNLNLGIRFTFGK